MLSDTFQRLQNKVYSDSRDFPVSLVEEHQISGAITESNRKIKLGEKVHSFNNLMVYKIFKSTDLLDLRIIQYENLAIFYSQIDLTVAYNSYDSTTDTYSFTISLYRSDTLESQNQSYDITGGIGDNNIVTFSTVWGDFGILIGNFITNARAVISLIGYESSILVIDSFNPFIGNGATNQLYFNVPANSVYINELPLPFSAGDIYVLVKYLGLGSIITAESLNDIINVVKYYNLLPKFEVVKNNDNDIQLFILGEYYYLENYIEKIEDATYQIEDEVLVAQQNAIVSFLDIPNHIFNIRRVSVGSTYNNLLADLTNYTNENPDYEIPIFIMIFDTDKNLFEYAYINRGSFSSIGGGSGVSKYNITFSNALNVSFSMTADRKPVINIQDQDGLEVIPDSIEADGTLVEVVFLYPQSGTIAAIN